MHQNIQWIRTTLSGKKFVRRIGGLSPTLWAFLAYLVNITSNMKYHMRVFTFFFGWRNAKWRFRLMPTAYAYVWRDGAVVASWILNRIDPGSNPVAGT